MHHALWDSWIHERDIAVPLGRTPEVEPDEAIASLRYVAALSPAVALAAGASGTAGFDVSVSDPNAEFHVAISGDVVVTDRDVGTRLPDSTGSCVDLSRH